MNLFRARTLASRPTRAPAYRGNEPAIRIEGRWFTSLYTDALRHLATLGERGEIVQVQVDDAIVDSYRVSTTPVTACGLEPGRYSQTPDTDFVLPMFRVMEAREVQIACNDADPRLMPLAA